MKKFIPQKSKNLYHLCRSIFSAVWFGFPSKKMKVIGVTGTNGKTTTTQMIARILEEAGKKVAVTSTINFKIGKKEWINKTKFTTLSGWHLQKFIALAVQENCEYLVLEVASHALDQNRIWGIGFDVAVITNVTREHLDYHKTMEQYRAAKLKLFGMIKEEGTAAVNLRMKKPEQFINFSRARKLLYGIEITNNKEQITNKFKIQNSNPIRQGYEGQEFKVISADKIELKTNGSFFTVNDKHFKLNLPGEFNIENALAAVCVGISQGIDLEICSGALGKITVIPGRMDEVKNDRGIKIIIDYALTPDSMQKLGEFIQNSKFKIQNSKLIWVFGSCGERDRGKRPIMGEIVAKYADYAIVTNEDPYSEDPQQIIDEVFAGVSRGGKIEGKNGLKIFDRKQAIKKALGLAQQGDMILITGKGAEETMAIGNKRVKWNDRKVVEELLGSV